MQSRKDAKEFGGKATLGQGRMGLMGLIGLIGAAADDLSAVVETISSLRRADPRVKGNTGTWKLNNKIKFNHRLSAQDVAGEKIQQKICWPI